MKLVEPGTLLLSYKLSIGKVGIAQIPMYTNEAIAALSDLSSKLEPSFMYWALQHVDLLRGADRAAMGATLNKAKLSEIKFPVPPLDEQRRIAAILDKADALRAKRREAIAKLDQLLQSVFIDMFGEPLTNPKGWPTVRLDEVCSKVIDCPHSTPSWSQSGVICLRTSNLGKGEWNWTDTRYVTEDEYGKRSSRGEIQPGDIILSREGTVGVLAIVLSGMRLCMGQRLVQLRVNCRKSSPHFLMHLLLHDLAPERISRLLAGSTSKHLNVKELRGLPINLPPLGDQEEFTAIAQRIEHQKQTLRQQSVQQDVLFSSLQHRAFTGTL